jgi:endonuclease/exonuclease/phosphatase family metal-dependent hydrolase
MLAVFAAHFLALFASITVGQAAIVRLLDYNIHRDFGGTDSNTSSQPALAKIVNYLRPDIWTINELGGNSAGFTSAFAHDAIVDFVARTLTIFGSNPREGVDYFVYVSALNDGFITNAVVSRYPFLTTQTFSDAGGGFAALRGLASALVDLPGETDVGVFTAHMKAGNFTSDAERRQAEANTNSANVATWMNAHPNAATLLTGDWNETEETGETTNWSGHRIGDLLPTTGEPYRPVSTMRFPPLRDAPAVSIRGDRDTISASNPTARFDYVVYSPDFFALQSALIFDTKQYTVNELAAINASSGTSLVAGDSALASDHLPVLAIFEVIPEPDVVSLLALVAVSSVLLRWRRPAGDEHKRPACSRSLARTTLRPHA